ncbi:MAG: response regulator, partial [Planctomycetota bacterium]
MTIASPKKIKVLIVDDSAVVRQSLSAGLSKEPDIEVVGTAVDPFVARDKILALEPDVITLDLEMPRMDGLTFLARLMKYHPIPVVVVSSLTPAGSQNALRAIDLGAIDVVCKPNSAHSASEVMEVLADKIRGAAAAKVQLAARPPQVRPPAPAGGTRVMETTHKILAIGASTGGTVALHEVLSALPADIPGTVIVQHMPEHFTSAFAIVHQRYKLRRAIIVTSNRVVQDWGKYLGDVTMASTILDRLMHRAVMLEFEGKSYRL